MYSPPAGESGRRQQSRIVINVDDGKKKKGAGGPFRRMGRGGRMLSAAGLAALVALAVALAVGFFWWQSYKRGPSYSLALLVDAARRDDAAAVEQLIDADGVAMSLRQQVTDKALASVGGLGTVAAPQRQVEAALPNLLAGMREQVRDEVSRGVKEAAAQSRAGDLPFFLLAPLVPLTTDITTQGEDAATVVLPKGDNRTTELTLKRDGERWRVSGIKDDELAASVAARVAGALAQPPPAAPSQQQGTRRRPRQR